METRTYIFEDPTGGGDDAKLTLPIWATEPPTVIVARDVDGERVEFALYGPEDDDE